MIRKFISRVFGHKSAGNAGEPAIIGVARHGIRREAISSGSRRTVETLQQQGYKAYVVGGGVRDLLLGLTPNDFDVATDAPPEAGFEPVAGGLEDFYFATLTDARRNAAAAAPSR